MTQTLTHPRATLRSVHRAVERGHRRSANGRVGAVARAVVDLHDQTAVETSRRFDRIEALLIDMRREMRADFAEVRGDIRGLKRDVAGLRTDVAGLKTDVAGLKTDVAGLNTDVAGLRTDVAGLNGKVNRIDSRVERIAGGVAANEAKGTDR